MAVTSDVGPFAIVPRWVRIACKGEPWALMVYSCLADHADRSEGGDGGWTIGRDEIAEEIGAGTSTVDRAVKVLTDCGALVVERHRAGKKWTWSRFFVRAVAPPPVTAPPVVAPPVTTLAAPPVTTFPITPLRTQEHDEMFERFWKAYPNAKAKPVAKRAFHAALRRGHEAQLRDGLKAWLAFWAINKTAVNFIPYPQKFLNQEHYMDIPTIEAVQPRPVAPPAGKPSSVWKDMV